MNSKIDAPPSISRTTVSVVDFDPTSSANATNSTNNDRQQQQRRQQQSSSLNSSSTSSSSSTPLNKRTKKKKKSAPQPPPPAQVGVADYFAILGVGEDLIWKHAQLHQQKERQKMQAAAFASGNHAGDGDDDENDAADEDDAMLLERFYREIVDISIMVAEEPADAHLTGDQNSTTLVYTKHHATSVVSSGYSSTHHHHHHAVSIPSPSPSDVTSAIGTEVEAVELEGWTLVQQTRPASLPTGVPLSSTYPTNHGGPMGGPHGNTSMSNQHRPTVPSLWHKGQTWEANLDPTFGLFGEIQSLEAARLQKLAGGNARNSTPLKDLRRKVQSTFNQHTYNPLRHYHPYHLPPKVKRKFYLSYRRRSPEESNQPAIADVSLMYVQLHKATLTEQAMHSYNGNNAATTTATGALSSSSTSILPNHTSSTMNAVNTISTISGSLSSWRNDFDVQSAVTASSVLSSKGAAALLRVAEAGKQAVQSRMLGGTPPAPPKSNNNNKGSNANSRMSMTMDLADVPTTPLEKLLTLPPNFTEWSIPEAYQELRLPMQSAGTGAGTPAGMNNASPGRSSIYSSGNSDVGMGVGATPSRTNSRSKLSNFDDASRNNYSTNREEIQWHQQIRPKLLSALPKNKNLGGNTSANDGEDSSVTTTTATTTTTISDGGGGSGSALGAGGYGGDNNNSSNSTDDYIYIPILAVRRQRIGEEERYHEDPAIVELAVSFHYDEVILPNPDMENGGIDDLFDDDQDENEIHILQKTDWSWAPGGNIIHQSGFSANAIPSPTSMGAGSASTANTGKSSIVVPPIGSPCILMKKNLPLGFCDAAFSTKVLDRFPYKNYKGMPLPEEELPMFCYPTGCRLHRATLMDAPLPQYYGFVVKNERGDSIYVSCVSFMEPLTRTKQEQLAILSEKRRRVSLPHARFWAKRQRKKFQQRPSSSRSRSSRSKSLHPATPASTTTSGADGSDEEGMEIMLSASMAEWLERIENEENSTGGGGSGSFCYDDDEDEELVDLLTPFDRPLTFENKTICLVSRYPYWTAFRRFLSHLHNVSCSSSEIPLERYISHLLLTVPIPKPGGPHILVPLPTYMEPMVLMAPPSKDLPLVDLPYERLLSCLDVPTIVTIVLGLLALERKVIVMSTRPNLVLDVCELLRSLIFPFDLCAPYVPRLTEPFMSCLDFPGAIFVGIHDDRTTNGLAATVRKNMPEDSTIVNLDTGSVDCSGDRITLLKSSWGIIPAGPRSVLITEIETLCRDASIVPGQEPLDSLVDSAFDVAMPSRVVQDDIPLSNNDRDSLDDRGIRDAFLRFFCSVMGGYERYLVVPDADYLISGNEWFDTKGFLSSATEEKTSFLGALVATQLFQSYIQRRTEASDVHCLLFDECLNEFHSSAVPYGRLGGDVGTVQGTESDKPHMVYSLLVNQAATEQQQNRHGTVGFDVDSGTGSDDDTDTSDQQENEQQQQQHSLEIPENLTRYSDFVINSTGDWVTYPSKQDSSISPTTTTTTMVTSSSSSSVERDEQTMIKRYFYCIDGNPMFPDRLNPTLYLPKQPESYLLEMNTSPTPMLTRSDREVDEANRRRKMATTYRGLQTQRRCMWQLPKLMGSHFLGAWLLCVPALVAQPTLTHEQQSRYLLRALGTLRLLRSKQRIVPDEAAYRALIVACGRTKNDRRMELVKLFGLLRSDGIFPSAVTLGQYTRALAEGYAKQSMVGTTIDADNLSSVEVTESASRDLRVGSGRLDAEATLTALDGNLANLEEAGRRWRQRNGSSSNNSHSNNLSSLNSSTGGVDKDSSMVADDQASTTHPPSVHSTKAGSTVSYQVNMGNNNKYNSNNNNYNQKKRSSKPWLPVVFSSSFVPTRPDDPLSKRLLKKSNVRLLAIWSRTKACDACGYIPLEEEIQAGWDILGGENDIPCAINCPRCGSFLIPMLGYKELTIDEALEDPDGDGDVTNLPHHGSSTTQPTDVADFATLPPQIGPMVEDTDASYVTYVSPAAMRSSLERHVDERGEAVLERDNLRAIDPELFYNFLWYCARFSLPLPLPVSMPSSLSSSSSTTDSSSSPSLASPSDNDGNPKHICALAAWDHKVAIRGCFSCARVLSPFFEDNMDDDDDENDEGTTPSIFRDPSSVIESLGDFPLLGKFNLQGYYSTVWDHDDMSEILVTLVEACDKRDFRPVVDCILKCNIRRREKFIGYVTNGDGSSNSGGVGVTLPMTSSDGNDHTTTSPTATPTPSSIVLLSTLELDCYRTILYLAKYQCTTAFHAFFPTTLKPCKGYHFWCPITPVPIFDRLLREAINKRNSHHLTRCAIIPNDNTDRRGHHHHTSTKTKTTTNYQYTPMHDVSDVALGFRSVFGHLM